MRVILTLLILLFFEVAGEVNYVQTKGYDPPNFNEYGYVPRWPSDLPSRLNGTVYYAFGTNVVLVSDKDHPTTTEYFIFDKSSIADEAVSLDIALRKLKQTDSACKISITQRLTAMGSTTCQYEFEWKEKDDLTSKNKFVNIHQTTYRVAAFNKQNPPPDCYPQPYHYNSTHSVFGIMFQTIDTKHCAMELILPAQFMLLLPKPDDPYVTVAPPVTKASESEEDSDDETTTAETASAGFLISPLIWVILALALLILLLLLIILFLIYRHFKSRKRIRILSEMITNANKANWADNGPGKTIDGDLSVKTAIEKSSKKSLKPSKPSKTKTTTSKTGADETEQTSVDQPSEMTTKKESATYKTLNNMSEVSNSTFKSKTLKPAPAPTNLVPAQMNTETERQRDKTPRGFLSNISNKIMRRDPKSLKDPGTQRSAPVPKSVKPAPAAPKVEEPASVAKTKSAVTPVAITPTTTVRNAIMPKTVFYSTRER